MHWLLFLAMEPMSRELKTCSRCGQTKPIDEFNRHKGRKDGRSECCKVCKRILDAEYRKRNPDKNKIDYARRISENPSYWAEYYAENRERELARVKKWSLENKDTVRKYNAEWYAKCGKDYHARWRGDNPEKMREKSSKAYQKRSKSTKFRLENSVKAGIHRTISSKSKRGRRSFHLLGYTAEELMRHLETRFKDGMSWENYGDWHIDHIIPLSAFNYETPDDFDFRRAWSLSNLQPLWAEDNLSKRAKLAAPFQPSLALAANDNAPATSRKAA